MLVCNVSLRPARSAIAATLAEAVTATDATATGVVFAALVDDPASAHETVNAFVGSIMIEAASAVDTVGVSGSVYAGAVVEATNAADVVALAASIYGAVLGEAATSVDDPDATVISAMAEMDAMLAGVFINSDGTSRQANANGVMVNL